MFQLLLLPLIIAVVIIFLFHRKSKLPPGPPGLPFIGNLLQFDTSVPHIYLWNLSKKYGPIMSMKLGKIPLLIISSSELAKEVLKTQDLAFCGRPKSVGRYKLSYNGIDVAFSTYNDTWREMRKISVLHVYSNKNVQSFQPIRFDEVMRVMRNISAKASLGESVNLSEIMMAFTGTLICRVAYGKEYDEEGSERRRFDKLMVEGQEMMGGLFFADILPLFGWVDKVSGMMSKLERVYNGFDMFFQELIDEHLASKLKDPNFLDLLIQLKDEKSCPMDFTWDHVKALCFDMLVGGTDTGAVTLVWAMTALMKNPRAMNKLQQEIRKVIERKDSITEDDLPKLTYLKAVVKEILRLFPPAPLLLPRETLQHTIINGYKIPPKTMVFVNAWAIARDPRFWENPNAFVPERFLNTEVDVIGQDFEVIPFGAGRRGCPAISMGLVTVELMLANLVYLFDFELPDGVKSEDIDFEVSPGIIMHKKNPLYLVPKNYL